MSPDRRKDALPDLNALFLKVGNYCRCEVFTCASFDKLINAAKTMQRLIFPAWWSVKAIGTGRQPDNFITLAGLNRMEQELLKAALEGVRSFQESLGRRYRLGQAM